MIPAGAQAREREGDESVSKKQESEATAELEMRALERMIAARSRQIQRCADAARSRGGLESREDDFQLQVFVERRTRAMLQLEAESSEPREIRIARLESLARALECSWEYFAPRMQDQVAQDDPDWAIRLK